MTHHLTINLSIPPQGSYRFRKKSLSKSYLTYLSNDKSNFSSPFHSTDVRINGKITNYLIISRKIPQGNIKTPLIFDKLIKYPL